MTTAKAPIKPKAPKADAPATHAPAIPQMANKTITFKGQKYTLLSDNIATLDFLEAMRNDDIIGVIVLAIGQEGYQRLKEQLKDKDTGLSPLSGLMSFMSDLQDVDPTVAS